MSTAQPGLRARHASELAGRTQTSDSPPERSAEQGMAALSADAARPAMTRSPLAGPDLYDWMALRRVSDGRIARMGDHWFDHGRPIPGYLADALVVLCDNGIVALAEPDAWRMQRAALTGTGTVRYRQLCRQWQAARPLPAPGSAQALTWLIDHPHAWNVVSSVWDTLTELEQSGHHPGAIAALRRVLAPHQPTPAGRCRACPRWRGRRRRYPCIVWHQIRGELQGFVSESVMCA